MTPTAQRSTTLAAAARLGIFEASAFAALSRTSRGLLAPCDSEFESHPANWYYSVQRATAADAPAFHVPTLSLPRSSEGSRASPAFIRLFEFEPQGNQIMAVLVDRETDYVWSQPMSDLSRASFLDMLLAYHKQHITSILDIDASECPAFALPLTLDLHVIDTIGLKRSIRTLVQLDASEGLLVNPAENVAHQLVFRAAHYMEQGGLAPRLFSSMLLAATCALNYCPRLCPLPSASRHEAMFQVQPDVSTFLAVPVPWFLTSLLEAPPTRTAVWESSSALASTGSTWCSTWSWNARFLPSKWPRTCPPSSGPPCVPPRT